MPDPIYWRLIYSDGSYEDEPLSNASIRLARTGAVALALTHPLTVEGKDFRQSFWELALYDQADVHRRLYHPVFYRKRSMAVDLNQDPRLDVTVVGRAREGQNTIDTNLWASLDGITVIACPDWAIDRGAIDNVMLMA